MTDTTFYLRRTNGSTNELLYLPLETIDLDYSNDLISPKLPGNSSAGIDGSGSVNIILNLGKQGWTIKASSTIIDLASTQYPDLPGDVATERYIITNSSNVVTVSATKVAQSAQDIRWALMNFLADMGLSTYTDFKINYPDFFENGADKLFEGNIRNCRMNEVAGDIAQFSLAIDWTVGLST